ncbi:MAG: ABC transporter ATP-binding protein/permease, partial [Caulobacterales bacterium]|nr:ABC transporter ATP-binding protein/permease [Caulobacterales bacterium]
EPPGALAARFVSDVERVREGVVRAATNLGRDLLTLIVMIGVMMWLDWMLALLVLVIYPLLFQPVTNIGRRVRAASTRAQEQMGGLSAFLSEGFAGARMVKTYGLEPRQQARAEDAFAERFQLSVRIARGRASVEPLLEIVGGAAFAGVAAFTAWRVANGGFPISKILGFVAALAIMAPAARAIGTLTAVAQEGLAALARVFAVVDEEPAIRDAPRAKPLDVREGRVTFEGVGFVYPDGSRALADIDLTLEPGATTALVGPSGGGKSTILNLLPRLYDVGEGAVRIDGTDVRDVTLASLRRQIAFVAQDAALFDDTVRANLLFGRPGAEDSELWEALEAAAARAFVEALPGGLDEPVGPGGGRLSGGERQRIALARAVLKDAPILLLDEATSALDARSEAQVQEALARLAQGRTTLVIAHRLATVRAADRIYVLDAGRIVESGDDASLRRAGGLYARLRKLQFTAEAAE